MMVLALALSLGATARAKDDLCQSEKSAWDRALEREVKARQALEAYDNGNLAPLVPGQADAERQRLQDKLDATWEDVKRAMAAHDRCVKRRTCKKVKGGWNCVVAWTYEKCCLDGKEDKDKDQKKGK
jgi:hypothetical protein